MGTKEVVGRYGLTAKIHPDAALIGSYKREITPMTTKDELFELAETNYRKFCMKQDLEELPSGLVDFMIADTPYDCWLQSNQKVDCLMAGFVVRVGDKVVINDKRAKACQTYWLANGNMELLMRDSKRFLFDTAQIAMKKLARRMQGDFLVYAGDFYLSTAKKVGSIYTNYPAIAKPFRCWKMVAFGKEVWLCLSLLNGGIFFADEELIPFMEPLPRIFVNGSLRFKKEGANWRNF